MVNLKRPTLRLSPLAPLEDNAQNAEAQENHAIEFEYDCNAPNCGVTIHVVVPPEHPLAKKDGKDDCKVMIFETTTEGGFSKVLRLDDGAIIELGAFEPRPPIDHSQAEESVLATSTVTEGEPASAAIADDNRKSRRFTAFPFRKRQQNRAVAGPALAVVDVDQADKDKEGSEMPATDEGVRIVIHLRALGKDGAGLTSANEQITYLQVVRMAAAPTSAGDDLRPWIVKVVKREATVRHLLSSLTCLNSELLDRTSHLPAPRNIWPDITDQGTCCASGEYVSP